MIVANHGPSTFGQDDNALWVVEETQETEVPRADKLTLARALVHRPRLLLLDEPLGALDALTRIDMQNLIEGLWQRLGFTAVLVTHDVAEAVALADRVVLIEDGRIALDQPVALARPRQRGDAAFARLEETVLRRVMKLSPDAPSSTNLHAAAVA